MWSSGPLPIGVSLHPGRVADLHLKIGKIPVYSANHWIESFAHTVYDEYHNIVSISYTNDPDLKIIHYNFAYLEASINRNNSGRLKLLHGIPIFM